MTGQIEQKKRTLLDLVISSDEKFKTPEEILDTFKCCSRKGVSFSLDNIDYRGILDKIDFSYEQVKRIMRYMENGSKVCRKKGREKDAQSYETIAAYLNNYVAIKLIH